MILRLKPEQSYIQSKSQIRKCCRRASRCRLLSRMKPKILKILPPTHFMNSTIKRGL